MNYNLTEQIKKPFLKWNTKRYDKKCEDIGQIISFGIFVAVIFYAVGSDYLDWVQSVLSEELTFSDDFYDNLSDDEKFRWMIIILSFISGVTILPVLILHYVSGWIGMGMMYVVWKITKQSKETKCFKI